MTAVACAGQTASTGYIQRRLVKAMEDVIIRYDGTVRNSCGDVIQFLYGEDGMDGQGIEDQKLPALKLSEKVLLVWLWSVVVPRTPPALPSFSLAVQDLREKYGYDLDAPRWTPNWLEPDTLNKLRTDMEARQLIDSEWETLR